MIKPDFHEKIYKIYISLYNKVEYKLDYLIRLARTRERYKRLLNYTYLVLTFVPR
jgi:hypothetical protein